MAFAHRLFTILSGLDQTFYPDELAYLAVTSKVEGPIRDRIAFALHNEVEPGFLVHREWRDPKKNGWLDIAITDEDNHPRYLLELKAHSGPTFEAGYTEKIRLDLRKLYKAAEEKTELYLIFIFNHLYHPEPIDPKFQYVIKYFDLQNFASRTNKFSADLSARTTEYWERHLQRIGVPLTRNHPGIQMTAGKYHGMPMVVHIYVNGPLYKKELAGLFA